MYSSRPVRAGRMERWLVPFFSISARAVARNSPCCSCSCSWRRNFSIFWESMGGSFHGRENEEEREVVTTRGLRSLDKSGTYKRRDFDAKGAGRVHRLAVRRPEVRGKPGRARLLYKVYTGHQMGGANGHQPKTPGPAHRHAPCQLAAPRARWPPRSAA